MSIHGIKGLSFYAVVNSKLPTITHDKVEGAAKLSDIMGLIRQSLRAAGLPAPTAHSVLKSFAKAFNVNLSNRAEDGTPYASKKLADFYCKGRTASAETLTLTTYQTSGQLRQDRDGVTRVYDRALYDPAILAAVDKVVAAVAAEVATH